MSRLSKIVFEASINTKVFKSIKRGGVNDVERQKKR